MGTKKLGEWTLVKQLGSGAFGVVDHWTNRRTNEEIAIKKCQPRSGTSQATKRWQTEVKMMEEMKHPNMVAFIRIPDDLKVEYPTHLSLGMEYCSMGDLRKQMAKAEFCCGMPEYHVRDILLDIGNAIFYLHQKNNMHRDLKPENIVLKPRPNAPGRFQFKVTDLGYAKDLNEHSCGQSFVGTLPYLAPEFVLSHNNLRYFNQVDYWSFGLLTFEVITGYRPFFHTSINTMALQVLNLIREKKDNEICAWRDTETDRHRFCDHIPPPHSLNAAFAEDVVKWLRLMLCIDEKKRGGRNGKEWYNMLQNEILSKKYIQVFHVKSERMLTFEVEAESPLNVVRRKIEYEAKVPITEQVLLLQGGRKPEDTGSIFRQLQALQQKQQSPEPATMYFFTTNSDRIQRNIVEVPKEIKEIHNEPTASETEMSNSKDKKRKSNKDEKRIFQISLSFLLTKTNTGLSICQALSSLFQSVSRLAANLPEMLQDFSRKHYKLEGMVELLQKSLEKDMAEIRSQDPVGICASTKFDEQCAETQTFIERLKEDLEGERELIARAKRELEKQKPAQSDLVATVATLQDWRKHAREKYDQYRREIKAMERGISGLVKETARQHEAEKLRKNRHKLLKIFVDDFLYPASNMVDNLLSPHNKYLKDMKFFVTHHIHLMDIICNMNGKLYQWQLNTVAIAEHQERRQHDIWVMLQYMKDVYNSANQYYKDETAVASMEEQIDQYVRLVDEISGDRDLSELLSFVPNVEEFRLEQAAAAPASNNVPANKDAQSNIARPSEQAVYANRVEQAPPAQAANSTAPLAAKNVMGVAAHPSTGGPVAGTTHRNPQMQNSISTNSNNNNSASSLEISEDLMNFQGQG